MTERQEPFYQIPGNIELENGICCPRRKYGEPATAVVAEKLLLSIMVLDGLNSDGSLYHHGECHRCVPSNPVRARSAETEGPPMRHTAIAISAALAFATMTAAPARPHVTPIWIG